MAATYYCRVLNLNGNPDSSGDVFDPAGVNVDTDVPVYLNFNRSNPQDCIGHARLEKKDDGVDAIITFYGDLPVGMFLAVGGSTLDRDGSIIKKCIIRELGISINNNADHDIGPIK